MHNKEFIIFEKNSITQWNKLSDEKKSIVPEGAIYFEGVVSNGDKNRNGYTIDPQAWFYDGGEHVKNFLSTGSVLWQHEDDKPIWVPLSFEVVGDEIRVSGYVFDDTDITKWAIGRWLVRGLSTRHMRHKNEWEFEGKRYTDEEFWKLPVSDIMKEWWERIDTQVEILEFSFVTIPSNRKSVVLMNKLDEYKTRNNLTDKQMEQLVNTPESEVPEVTPEVTEAKEEVPAPEMATKEEVNSLVSAIESLKLQVAETNSLKQEVEELKNKLSEQKELAQIVLSQKNEVTDEQTFKNKYK